MRRAGSSRTARTMNWHAPCEGAHGEPAPPSQGAYTLLGCYHPSLQNTNTGRLTPDMMDDVLAQARALLR